tara:strand:+ start:3743 stop:4684 length:942 start_codon:yes stop_codon:yes gene_type:complete
MAILRGGRRIGNMDIRIGLPRDKSMNNIPGDRRLKQKVGGNPESTINRFIAQINQGEGMARPTRFLCVFYLPKILSEMSFTSKSAYTEKNEINNDLESPEMARNVGMMCHTITMPSRNVNSKEHKIYGPAREMPHGYTVLQEIGGTFYGDKFLRQRLFFENWQKKIFNINTHNMHYYEDYAGTMDIYQLGQFASENDRDRVTYGVRLYEVYPDTLNSLSYGYDKTDEVMNVGVKFKYRTWQNLLADQVDGATIGDSFGELPTIKASKDFGLFSGILNRLPPEIRRVGRDVLQTVKRNLPIGKTTGGRVFPPFL